jgi:hypothetical protein
VDLWVFRIGPMPLVDAEPYSSFVGILGMDLLGTQGDDEGDEDAALANFAALAQGARLRCDPTLAAAAARNGYEPGELPPELLALRAAFAITFVNGDVKELEGPEDLLLMMQLVTATQRFWDALQDLAWPPFVLHSIVAEGAIRGEYIVKVDGDDPAHPAFFLLDRAQLTSDAEMLERSGRIPDPLPIPDYFLLASEEPPFAHEALAAIGLSAVPRIKGATNRDRDLTVAEVLLIAATAEAIVRLRQDGAPATGRASVGETEVVATVRASPDS